MTISMPFWTFIGLTYTIVAFVEGVNNFALVALTLRQCIDEGSEFDDNDVVRMALFTFFWPAGVVGKILDSIQAFRGEE